MAAKKAPLKVAKQEPIPAPPETVTAQVQEEVPGKTVLSFTKPTPMWATIVFRTVFILMRAVQIILGGTALLKTETVKEALIWLAAFEFAVWALGRSIGVSKEAIEKEVG